MKKLLLFLMFPLFWEGTIIAQEDFFVHIEPMVIDDAPGVHSFAFGKTSDEQWIVLGGRIDGLHQRQPFAAFLASDNNQEVFLIDPMTHQVTSAYLGVLPAPIFEQLQSTNQEFYQRGNTLYVIGGYGYSASHGDHVTYPNMTAIDLDGLAGAISNEAPISPYFRQITDDRLAVTGGQIGYLNGIFYLCGGQYFEGRYNPMGPDHGPGFIQNYTDEIRKFEISDDGTNLSIENYTAINDPQNLHRRDYNMTPQVFPTGEKGFTMFSGVFQYDLDIPWLTSVDITEGGYTVNDDFAQYLSQYHSAKIPIYDENSNTMHTVFFGGMSQYFLDEAGNLVQDNNVPFVNTISKITRNADGVLTEHKLDAEMPGLLGSGAEFIPVSEAELYLEGGILDLNLLPYEESVLVGYIYGGIESTSSNIFFINTGTQSSASQRVFKVFLTKTIVANREVAINGDNIYNINVFPNPVDESVEVSFFVPNNHTHYLSIYSVDGRLIKSMNIDEEVGRRMVNLDLSELASGTYILSIKSGKYISKKKIIKL